jgi:hypothetical protein
MRRRRTMVGRQIGNEGRESIIVEEDQTERIVTIPRMSLVRPVDQAQGLNEYEFSEDEVV